MSAAARMFRKQAKKAERIARAMSDAEAGNRGPDKWFDLRVVRDRDRQ
jgi:hypothetical protein